MMSSKVRLGKDFSHYLDAVAADSLVTGTREESYLRVGQHQQAIDFVCVSREHCDTLHALDAHQSRTQQHFIRTDLSTVHLLRVQSIERRA